jgi:HK97 family phage prohead protease
MIERSFSGSISRVEGRALGAPLTGLTRKSFEGQAIVGRAATYLKPHVYQGRIEAFARNCFRGALASGATVKALIAHDLKRVIGCTDTNLTIASDNHGLIFKLRPSESLECRAAFEAVEARSLAEVSTGYSIVSEQTITVDGTAVSLITAAHLAEISLVKRGAVPGVFAGLVADSTDHLNASSRAAERLSVALSALGYTAEGLSASERC